MKILLAIILAAILLGCVQEKTEIREENISQNFLNPQLAVFRDGDIWKAQITFTLPNPCHKMNYTGKEVKEEMIALKFQYTPPSPDEVCIQMIQKYNRTVELGKLSKGDYRILIRVNNSDVKSMEITI